MPQYLYVLLSKLIRQLDGRNCNLSNAFVNLQETFPLISGWVKALVPRLSEMNAHGLSLAASHLKART